MRPKQKIIKWYEYKTLKATLNHIQNNKISYLYAAILGFVVIMPFWIAPAIRGETDIPSFWRSLVSSIFVGIGFIAIRLLLSFLPNKIFVRDEDIKIVSNLVRDEFIEYEDIVSFSLRSEREDGRNNNFLILNLKNKEKYSIKISNNISMNEIRGLLTEKGVSIS